MDNEDLQSKSFMLELYSMTGSDRDAQVSMYDVGESLGLDKGDTSALAQDLIINEWVELKTLSGGIGITIKGLEVLQVDTGESDEISGLNLGNDTILCETGKQSLLQVLTEIKNKLPSASASYEQLEEIVIDIKTIETQLLSPKPKTTVIRSTLLSIGACLEECGMNNEGGMASKLASN